MARNTKQDKQAVNLRLSKPARQFLGLSQQPFAEAILSADAIFTDAVLDQLLATLSHHMQFSDLILIVEGELGSGKTTLFRRLIQSELSNLKLLSIQAEATDTMVQIQQKMSLHLLDQGDANYLDDNLKNLQVFDQAPVLIIDNAHVLSDISLQELLRYQKQLEAEHGVQLKLLLLANKGMAKTLEQISDLQHNQLFVQQMPKFNAKQINRFISHKMHKAGFDGDPAWNKDDILAIAKKTGLPSEIMQLMTQRLEKIARKKNRSSVISFSSPVLIFTVLLLLGGAIAIYFLPLTNLTEVVEEAPQAIDRPPVFVTPEKTRPQKATPTVKAKIEAETMGTAVINDAPASNESATIKPTNDDDAGKPDPMPTLVGTTDTGPITGPAKTPTAKPITSAPIKPPVEKTPPKPALSISTRPKQAVAPTAVKAAPSLTSRPPQTKSVAKPQPKPVKGKAPIDPVLQQLARLGLRDANWLRQQNANHWTLQILGARDPATLLKFSRQHHLGKNTAWYQTQLKGQPWYVLVHRFYTDKDVARQSISRLPAALQRSRPWVKSLSSIQKALK